MTYVKQELIVLLLLGLLAGSLGQSTPVRSNLPSCSAGASESTLEPSSSCVLDVTSVGLARQLQLLGAGGPKTPTVLLKAPSGFAGPQGLQSLTVSNVILEGTDNFPNHAIDLAGLLRPPLVPASTAVNLTNVALLHSVTAAQAAVAIATLRGMVSDPIVQRGIANWELQLYTDYVSFVYVARYTAPGLSCNGCGVFLRFVGSGSSANSISGSSSASDLPTSTPDEPQPGVNYLLGVDNSTFIPSLVKYGSISSPRPFLVMLSSNISWGRHPLLKQQPGGYMELNRPVVILSQHGMLTAIDMGMVANSVHLTAAYSNLTLHGMHLENMGYGDRQSGQQSAGLSIMNPSNVWLLYWPRQDVRFSLVDTTTVFSHQENVQYLIYWQIMTTSSDPVMRAESAWTQRGPGISVWESIVYPKRLFEIKFVCRTSLAKDTWRVSTPSVFPQLPDNVADPSLYQTGLKAHSAAPLASLVADNSQLQRWLSTLSGLPRDGLSMVAAPSVSLGPDTTSSWPPAGNVVLRAPKTVLIGQTVCESAAASSSSSLGSGLAFNGRRAVSEQMPQRVLLEGLGLSAESAAAEVQCGTLNGTGTADSGQLAPLVRLAHYPMVDWGLETALLQLQPLGDSGVLELSSLTLLGLAQGGPMGLKPDGAGPVGRRLAAQQLAGTGSSSSSGLGIMRSSSVAEVWEVQQLPKRLQSQQQWQRAAAASGPSRSLTAAAAAEQGSSDSLTQADVRVWTHVVWAVQRAPTKGQLVLRSVSMGLPQPEFKRLLAASRAGPGGAFTIPLNGGGALAAKSSSLQDNCCLLISSYTAPSMNATQLLLFEDPDLSRSTPSGYFWPYDGAEGTGARAGRQGVSGTGLSSAALTGLIVALCGAAVLAAVLAWVLVARRRRHRRDVLQQQYAGQDGSSIYKQPLGNTSNSQNSIYGGMHSCGGQEWHGRPGGPDGGGAQSCGQQAALQRQSGSQQSAGTNSGSGTGVGETIAEAGASGSAGGGGGAVLGNKRWQKLTTAISSKVQDIHQQRLRTALMQSQVGGSMTVGGAAVGGAAAAADAAAASRSPRFGGMLHTNNSSQSLQSFGSTAKQGGSSAAATGGEHGSLEHQQQQRAGASPDGCNTLELKELIGRGTFGTVYRANWQGVSVAVKLLQLPPGTGRTMTESGMFSGSGGAAGLLRAVGGWGNAASISGSGARNGDLMKHEHMAVQEAAIGSCMMHPNIVSVYSISLRPSGPRAPLAAKAGLTSSGGSSGAGGMLLLREDGTVGASELNAGGGPTPSAASLELLPWEMQLIMEFCDQGTLREALDAGMLVNKSSGLHDIPIVLSLAHNVACAMAYLHQEHIIHGDLKASNVLLKTCVPAAYSSSSGSLQPTPSQPGTRPYTAPGLPTTGSWSLGDRQGAGMPSLPSGSNACRPAAGLGSNGSSGPCLAQPPSQQTGSPPGPADGGTGGAAGAGQGGAAGASSAAAAGAVSAEAQGPLASKAIIDAAAAAGDSTNSGMHSLLKCGWVVAKVSDFGLSLCVQPEETHVSSVHAGTLTHMAPEHLMLGRCSKASDVYAFGILLWEVATGGKAFAGIPKPLLGHCVISQGMRPTWPSAMRSGSSGEGPWAGLVSLTERCWAQEPAARPSFSEVVQQLARLLRAATSVQPTRSVVAAPPAPPVAAPLPPGIPPAGWSQSSGPPGIITPGQATPSQAYSGLGGGARASTQPGCYGTQGMSSSGNGSQQQQQQRPGDPGGNGQQQQHDVLWGNWAQQRYGAAGVRSLFSGLLGDRQGDAGSSVGGIPSGGMHTVVPVSNTQQAGEAVQQQEPQQQQQQPPSQP